MAREKQPDLIREPIKQMTGYESAEAMADALPTNTMQPPEGAASGEVVKPKRKYTKRTPVPIVSEPSLDPLMDDPRYREAIEEMRTAGLSTTVKTGFDGAALVTKDDDWKLEKDEFRKVDNFSYVLSKKYPILDPSNHWVTMALYFFALLGSLIFKRMAKINAESWSEKIKEFFGFAEEPEKTAQELENEKAMSV
jgi:hypothetical protein